MCLGWGYGSGKDWAGHGKSLGRAIPEHETGQICQTRDPFSFYTCDPHDP